MKMPVKHCVKLMTLYKYLYHIKSAYSFHVNYSETQKSVDNNTTASQLTFSGICQRQIPFLQNKNSCNAALQRNLNKLISCNSIYCSFNFLFLNLSYLVALFCIPFYEYFVFCPKPVLFHLTNANINNISNMLHKDCGNDFTLTILFILQTLCALLMNTFFSAAMSSNYIHFLPTLYTSTAKYNN